MGAWRGGSAVEVSRDPEPVDWDAAWEALVLRLQRPRHRRIASTVGQAVVALAATGLSLWLLVQLIAEPLHELGRMGA
jgi:hypothetical protein